MIRDRGESNDKDTVSCQLAVLQGKPHCPGSPEAFVDLPIQVSDSSPSESTYSSSTQGTSCIQDTLPSADLLCLSF